MMLTLSLSDEAQDVIIKGLRIILLVGEEREMMVAAQLLNLLLSQPSEEELARRG
jgi:hypothetical protein